MTALDHQPPSDHAPLWAELPLVSESEAVIAAHRDVVLRRLAAEGAMDCAAAPGLA